MVFDSRLCCNFQELRNNSLHGMANYDESLWQPEPGIGLTRGELFRTANSILLPSKTDIRRSIQQ